MIVFRTLLLSWLLLLTVMIPCGECRAEETNRALSDPLARELKLAGDEKMVAGEYDAALSSYEKATAIEAHPSLLYNRARALQALERYTQALSHFEEFKRQAPSELLELVPQLDEMIQGVRENVAFVTFSLKGKDRPKEARVFVRGVEVIDPFSGEKRFNAGAAKIRIESRGYRSYEKKLQLHGGKELAVARRLKLLPKTGVLRITSKTRGAQVLIDGKSAGMVPVEKSLDPGPHKITVRHPDFITSKTSGVVQTGKTKTVNVDLEKRPSIYQKWWFWAGIGTAVAVGTSVAIAYTTERSPDKGDIPPGTISVDLD